MAYILSGLTMLLWVACVLPAGRLVDPAAAEDLATPLYREAWLLVPALLLLIIGPVGVVLSTTRTGRLAVLALTDTFIAAYAGIGLWASGVPNVRATLFGPLPERGEVVATVFVGLLLTLAVLSLYETQRVLRRGPDGPVAPMLKGLRLAICILVLLTPTFLLISQTRELASLLVPFGLVAISAAGAAFARAPLSLRFTASLVHLALAVHVVITLRFTIFDGDPRFQTVSPVGWATLGLAGGILLLAFVHALWLGGKRGAMTEDALPVARSLS